MHEVAHDLLRTVTQFECGFNIKPKSKTKPLFKVKLKQKDQTLFTFVLHYLSQRMQGQTNLSPLVKKKTYCKHHYALHTVKADSNIVFIQQINMVKKTCHFFIVASPLFSQYLKLFD